MNKIVIYTIGHSNLDFEDFLNLLKASKIEALIDVRRLPGSDKFPQYNQDTLKKHLAQEGINYYYCQGLTGRRSEQSLDPFINQAWTNQSFHNYADYAYICDEFKEGLTELLKLAKQQTCVIMCAEGVWWRCHRRIIVDYLLARDIVVKHILNSNVQNAKPTEFAVIDKKNNVFYPKVK